MGVAGTIFKEEGYSSETDSFEGHKHVSGQCQLFRKKCFAEIGGYVPHREAGRNRLDGCDYRPNDGLDNKIISREVVLPLSASGNRRAQCPRCGMFSYGEKDFYLGGHPIWELFRVTYRTTKRPYLFAGLALGLGYSWAFAAPHASVPFLEGTDDLPPQRADGQTKGHPQILVDIPASG